MCSASTRSPDPTAVTRVVTVVWKRYDEMIAPNPPDIASAGDSVRVRGWFGLVIGVGGSGLLLGWMVRNGCCMFTW